MNTYRLKKFGNFEYALLIGLCAALLYCLFCAGMEMSIAEKVLRLHIVANSDSEEDQRVKLAVRDAVLDVYGTQDAESFDEAYKNAEEMLPSLENAANEALKAEGVTDKASVYLGKCEFPYKNYGAYSLPSGEYTALNIVIGEGEGHNWWCVMYPSLCVSPEPKSELEKSTLTKKERRFITSDGKYEIRFRILDWIREWR